MVRYPDEWIRLVVVGGGVEEGGIGWQRGKVEKDSFRSMRSLQEKLVVLCGCG